MCGILGYIGECEDDTFASALDKISHRGPDGHEINKLPGATFGHRRLAIIDLSENGAQPMTLLDRYTVVQNGEIYNYKELRKELKKEGCRFKSQSDTEVLLWAYIFWGKNCLNKLNGMWAFAIWDQQEKNLFLSRDRIGKKPLYYAYLPNNGFVFASEMKAIYPFLSNIEINHELIDYAKRNNYHYETQYECLIKKIFRFPSKSFGIYKDNNLKLESYWDPLADKTEIPANYADQVERFRELFLDSCKLRMRSDVSIGTALSGGLDSTATISSMAYISRTPSDEIVPSWQHAFIASFPGTELDETYYAKKAVEHINVDATFVDINPLIDIDNIYYQTYLFEELYTTSPLPFIQLYRVIKDHGIKVTLDGHGADELFGGYPWDVLVAKQDAFPALSQVKEVLKTYYSMVNPDYTVTNREALGNIKNIFIERLKGKLKKHAQLDYLGTALYCSTYFTMLPTLLRNYDRYSMINGVEIRMPFLDYRLLNFALALPWDAKIRNGFSKNIVRDSLKDILPLEIKNRKTKIGFGTPFSTWLKGPLKEWILTEINSTDFSQSQLINPAAVRKNIMNWINSDSKQKDQQDCWKMLMPFIWEKSLTYINNKG